ncbi:MAG TPA: hypothetical protein VHT70_04310 [Candidatus Saccharimonadales bacterium]|jgi:hypothetical protein|nr:hypothetical protein [Candidatus Saccharimonadales bacterium]
MLTQNNPLWYARNGVWKRLGRTDKSPPSSQLITPGYYLGGGADINPDMTTYNINLKGHTTYTSWAQGIDAFPRTSWEDTLGRNGFMINYVWEPKVYSNSQGSHYVSPNATMVNWGAQQFYGWTQVTSGALDPLLTDVANAVKALPYNINIQICSERDTDHQSGGAINGTSYTWAQLDALSVTAISYIINFFKNTMGVTNVTFSGGIAGFNQAAFDRSYCSDVDVIQYNAYNHGTWQDALPVFSRTYAWLTDLPADSETKPVWLAEWGCMADARRPAWLESVPAAVGNLPRIAYMSYFNSGWGQILSSDTTSMQALATCYNDRIFGGTG